MAEESSLDDKSLEELEAMLESPMELSKAPPDPSGEETPQSEQAETSETEQPSDEPESGESEPEPVEQPTEVEATEQEAPDGSYEEQIRKTLNEESEARAKHFESVAGRNAGELGFVKKQLEELKQALFRPQAQSENGGDDYQDPPPAQQTTQPVQSDALTQWAMNQALKGAVEEFRGTHPDLADFSADITKHMSESQFNAQPLIESRNPMYAAQEIQRSLEEAYWHVKVRHHQGVRAGLEEKRASQIRDLRKAKISGTPTQTGATPAPRPVADTEPSIDELRRELERLAGE